MRYRFTVLLTLLMLGGCATSPMERVGVAPDHKTFALYPSGKRFVAWGHNGSAFGLDGWDARPWSAMETEFRDMHEMGANVIRVHLQFPVFMDGPNRPNARALAGLRHLLALSEKYGVYLDITGLGSYRRKQRAAWYDALPDHERWAQQAKFWEAIAETCRNSPAVFCYDLANEPIAASSRKRGWYMGNMGGPDGWDYLQALSLDEGKRPAPEIVKVWTHIMVSAIHRKDRGHMITIGMLPAWGIPPQAAAPELDFMAVHIYPGAGKVAESIATLKRFDFGKPIVVEETFPLGCGVAEERKFLLESRGIAAGWIGQYPRESLEELEKLKREGKLNLGQAVYLSWLDLFREVGAEMKGYGA